MSFHLSSYLIVVFLKEGRVKCGVEEYDVRLKGTSRSEVFSASPMKFGDGQALTSKVSHST